MLATCCNQYYRCEYFKTNDELFTKITINTQRTAYNIITINEISEINPNSQSQNTSVECIMAHFGNRFQSELSALEQSVHILCSPSHIIIIQCSSQKHRLKYSGQSVAIMSPRIFLPSCSGLITIAYLFNRNFKRLPLYNIKYLARLHA